MGNDVPTDRLRRVLGKGHSTRISDNLIGNEHCHTKLFGKTSQLPQELRDAITFREVEGMSYEEIAQALDCPIGTVRSRIFRAREAISARIKPMLDRQTGKRW